MAQIIPFEKGGKVPAHVGRTGLFEVKDDLVVAGGFPVLSIKGKVFHITRGDEKTLVSKIDEDGDEVAASSIGVVVVNYNADVSKTYYVDGYTEGSVAKPDCYSSDGVAPAPDAETPQAKKCAACPHNQWGSRITEDGKKAKACSDVRRMAVANPDAIDDPMLLRIPATSLKAVGEYQKMLTERGVAIQEVVTRVGFDATVAYPALTFKPIGFIDEDTAKEVADSMDGTLVRQIIGLESTPAQVDRGAKAETPTPDEEELDEEELDEEVPVPRPKAKAKKKKTKKKASKKAQAAAEAAEAAEDAEDAEDELATEVGGLLDDFDDLDFDDD